MKHVITTLRYQLGLFILLMMNTVVALAQDGGKSDGGDASVSVSTNSSTTTTTETWYTQPWVWIIGVAVFVLLLVALLRGRSKT
jgi:hypothetical protein